MMLNRQKLTVRSWIIWPLVLIGLACGTIWTWVFAYRYASNAMSGGGCDDHLASLIDRIHDHSTLLDWTNSSASNLARLVGSSMYNAGFSSFASIEEKIAPVLFLALSTIQWVSQVSYIGRDGLVFSYYLEGNDIFAIYSNASHSFNASASAYPWYSQLVDVNTGARSGDAIVSTPPSSSGYEWLQYALDGKQYSSWGLGFGNASTPFFLFASPVAQLGIISIGTTVKDFADFVVGKYIGRGVIYLTTQDGHPLTHIGLPQTEYTLSNDIITVRAISENKTTVREINVSCHMDSYSGVHHATPYMKQLDIQGQRYKFNCFSINAAGNQLISVVAFSCNHVVIFQRITAANGTLFSLFIVGTIIGCCILLYQLKRTKIRESLLRSMLIKQKEATQQAERKSMNKSMAFASASHDIRTSLAGITGLIELCHSDAIPDLEMDKNLVQMNLCASKLLGILNSVLDISKVEAGKMHLEEVEFDMSQVLEESIDIFHVVALRKGLEVIWDPCDNSVLRSSIVKGDCRRFKQILDNLLGNSVKFTSEGHVVVRAWTRKPNLESFQISSGRRHGLFHILGFFSQLFYKNKCTMNQLSSLNSIQYDPSSIEYVFEVDDTGIGIPKEKRASVFENYVQVKEASSERHEGTGLGLGIVQSFVRLMGGEIAIIDKEPGERGTCIRFNIFLKSTGINGGECSNVSDNQAAYQLHHQQRRKPLDSDMKLEGILAVLLVQGEETRRIVKKWLQNLGIKVWIIQQRELQHTIEKVKNKFLNNSTKFDPTQIAATSNRSVSIDFDIEMDGSTSCNEENNHVSSLATRGISTKTSFKGSVTRLVLLIDASCGNLMETCSVLKNSTKNISKVQYKVVWLVNSNTPAADLIEIKQSKYDLILNKPFHGSRMYKLLSVMENLEGSGESQLFELRGENASFEVQQSPKEGLSEKTSGISVNPKVLVANTLATEESTMKSEANVGKPLSGMKILVVEDNRTIRMVTSTQLRKSGATIEESENGLDALKLVKQGLQEAAQAHDASTEKKWFLDYFPYNVILMDCEMPVMDGYEAAKQIRMEEERYGCHIPIIALTAHATHEEGNKILSYGMDFHLTKPYQMNELLKAMQVVINTNIT